MSIINRLVAYNYQKQKKRILNAKRQLKLKQAYRRRQASQPASTQISHNAAT